MFYILDSDDYILELKLQIYLSGMFKAILGKTSSLLKWFKECFQ